jgi:hypothetical protein
VSRPLKGVPENGISSPSLLRRGGAGPRIAALAVAAGAREFWAISALPPGQRVPVARDLSIENFHTGVNLAPPNMFREQRFAESVAIQRYSARRRLYRAYKCQQLNGVLASAAAAISASRPACSPLRRCSRPLSSQARRRSARRLVSTCSRVRTTMASPSMPVAVVAMSSAA